MTDETAPKQQPQPEQPRRKFRIPWFWILSGCAVLIGVAAFFFVRDPHGFIDAARGTASRVDPFPKCYFRVNTATQEQACRACYGSCPSDGWEAPPDPCARYTDSSAKMSCLLQQMNYAKVREPGCRRIFGFFCVMQRGPE